MLAVVLLSEGEREDERGEIRFGVATVSVSVCGCSSVARHRDSAIIQKHGSCCSTLVYVNVNVCAYVSLCA